MKQLSIVPAFGWVIAFVLSFCPSYAQTPPITPSGLNTQVSGPIVVGGQTQYDITGGTRPGGGANLFHSFGDFSVPTDNIANFLNETPNIATSNILARVTGGDPSVIFGRIQTNGPNGFGNANLFLMNPHGFLFGPNATLNVGGMVAFTTADYLGFQGTNTLFNTGSTPESLSLLSTVPVAAFGFIGSDPAAIAIQGSSLQVAQGQTLSFVGGNTGYNYIDPDTGNTAPASVPGGITMTGGELLAFGGQINLASVASPGEILLPNLQSAPNINGQSFATMGDIRLAQGALLDVSADASGTVRIRGGQFVMENASISADTGSSHGAPLAVDIAVTGNLSITSDQASAITARATDAGNAGEIRLAATNLDASFGFLEFIPLIDSHTTSGVGNAGAVTMTADQLTAALTLPSLTGVFIHTGTGGEGNGGDVTINVGRGEFRAASIYTGDSLLSGTGSAGNLTVTGLHSMADSLLIDGLIDGVPLGITWDAVSFNAKGGAVTLEAHDIQIRNSASLDNTSLLGNNPLTIRADRLVMDNLVRIISSTGLGEGGGITFTGNILELTNTSTFLSQTFGDGPAGPIRVTATERVLVADDPSSPSPSGLFTNSFGDAGLGTDGTGGDIEVTTKVLDIRGGARFNATTQSGGNAGNITVNAEQSVSISGEFPSEPDTEFLGLGSTRASGIYTRTVGSEFCGDSCGNGGDTTINTRSFSLLNGAVLNNGTTNSGQAGTITVNATDNIVISGTLSDGRPGGIFSRSIGSESDAGTGGNITLTAGKSVTMSNGAAISASSTGPGNAGNISIDAGNRFEARNSSVTTKSEQAGGGNIEINARDRFRLVNSQVNASAFLDGGNITIDPRLVLLQNSQILAQSIHGNGGNITITTPLFLSDQSSFVSASSQFGLNGTVTIQKPTSNLSGSLGTLTSKPSQTDGLLTQRCAALANGQASSFVVAGREQLPADPGSWLTSPLYAAAMGLGVTAEGVQAEGERLGTGEGIAAYDTDRVSLRRLTPARFLIANFADSEATGCHS